ncbi:MAG: hypothetical protein H6712_05375 [Myxococcales bacterium]|nr:hypothetical protein [Myxococcales bacterium]
MNHIVKIALAAAVLVTGCDEGESTTVGSRGGMVVSADGQFSIEIPEGALEHDVDITIEQVDCMQPNAIGPCYEVGPVGMPLLFPAEVVYELDEEMMEGLRAEELEVLVERDHDWRPLPDHRVDMADEVVTASAVYLSSYAVVVNPGRSHDHGPQHD